MKALRTFASEREITPPLNDADLAALQKSTKALRDVIDAMQSDAE